MSWEVILFLSDSDAVMCCLLCWFLFVCLNFKISLFPAVHIHSPPNLKFLRKKNLTKVEGGDRNHPYTQ